MKRNIYSTLLLALLLTFTACSDNDEALSPDYDVLVLNQGQFGNGNASITGWNSDSKEIQQEYFRAVTSRPLGDVAQSAFIANDELVIVVNNSHKLEIVDPITLESIKTVSFEEEVSPRNGVVAGDHIFVSTFSDNVLVLNSEYEIVSQIETGVRTEGIAYRNGKIFVAESFFADFSSADKLTVINPQSFQIEERITLRSGPSHVFADSENRIWVTTAGDWGEDNGAVYIIDAVNYEIIEVLELESSAGAFAASETLGLAFISGGGAIRSIDMNTFVISATGIERNYNGLALHPTKSQLFAADAKDFTQAGSVSVYDVSGSKTTEFTAGLIPGGFFFLE